MYEHMINSLFSTIARQQSKKPILSESETLSDQKGNHMSKIAMQFHVSAGRFQGILKAAWVYSDRISVLQGIWCTSTPPGSIIITFTHTVRSHPFTARILFLLAVPFVKDFECEMFYSILWRISTQHKGCIEVSKRNEITFIP